MPKVSLKANFPEVQKRFAAWWNNSSLGDRPIVQAYGVKRPDAPPRPQDARPRQERELDPQWQLASARWALASRAWPAETLPHVGVTFANDLAMSAALAGRKLDYRDDGHCWMEEIPDIYQRELAEFSLDHPLFARLDAAGELMARELGDQAIVSPPPLLDGLTTLSVLRGAEQLCVDLLERPDDVKRVSAYLDRLALNAHSAFCRTLARCGQRHSVTWAGVYAPGSCDMPQCDFSVNISPAMFDEFALPGLRQWAAHFDYCCYHLDGMEQWRFIDRLCAIDNFRAIQFQPGSTHRDTMQYLPYFKEIHRRGRALWVGVFDTQTPVALTRELGPDGLMFSVSEVESASAVEEMLGRLEQAVIGYRATGRN